MAERSMENTSDCPTGPTPGRGWRGSADEAQHNKPVGRRGGGPVVFPLLLLSLLAAIAAAATAAAAAAAAAVVIVAAVGYGDE